MKYYLVTYDIFLLQWTIAPVIFLAYRVCIAIYCTIWLILASTVMYQDQYPVPVYLTYWAYSVLCFHLILAAIITVLHTQKSTNHCLRMKAMPLAEDKYNTSQSSVNTSTLSSPSSDQPTSDEIIYSRENSKDADVETSDEERVMIKIKDNSSTQTSIRWYMKLDWILFSISCPLAVIITTVYFYKVFPLVSKHTGKSVPEVDDLHIHGINTVVVVMEITLSALPVRFLYFCFPLIYSILYIISTAIFWSLDHSRVLYGGLVDWKKPGRTILVTGLLGFVALPVVHFVFFGLYKLKVYLHRRQSK